MNNDINVKKVVFYSIVTLFIIISADLFLEPKLYFKFDFLDKYFQKITAVQNISPKRLFVNVWRITRNYYVDKSLNNQTWTYWKHRYFKQIKTLDDAYIAINTMLASLNDPYTKFLKSSSYSKQKVIVDSKITGVGLLFDRTGDKIVVNHVLDNSPAKAANILSGDTIVSLNGKHADSSDIDELIDSVVNGTTDKVKIVIKRDDKLIEKELTKEEIYIKTMYYDITKDNIGIISLYNIMGEKAVDDFKDIILKTNDTSGLIIDLRNNYGGILANAIQMADFMVDGKELISIEARDNKKYQIYAENGKIFKDKPIVILINKYTASAAEIFAGILRDNLNAVLVGENSYGKNSIQQIIPLYNQTGLILTTDKYILPNGYDIHKKGLIPDFILPFSFNNDEQMKKAIELIKSYNEKK